MFNIDLLKKKAIIFGASGQDGFYLDKLLKKHNIEVKKSSRNRFIKGNIGDFDFVNNLIKDAKPDYIFNFAASSNVDHSFIKQNFNSISNGTFNILESVCSLKLNKTKIFLSGSIFQFKNDNNPITENSPLDYSNHYSVLRNNSLYMSRYYRDILKLNIYFGFFCNHDSPLRSDKYVNSYIIKSLLDLKNNKINEFEVFNMKYFKEFNHAKDVVGAVWKLVNQEKINELIIGSGKSYSIQEWIDICSKIIDVNISKKIINNEKNNLTKKVVSNPKKLFSIGFKPQLDIYDLANDMINEFN